MVRKLTQDLYDALMMDTPLRAAMIVDFGLVRNGGVRHSLLQRAVRSGATVEELDEALGNGEKLAKLVKDHTEMVIKFETAWDVIRKETQDQVKELEAKEVLTEDERLELDELYETLKTL